ncbi:MAG: zinc ribbon domain-containing protein [Oscillospiraceae bacterium]|nr:zinc ribbon domain-containing protein [Oscillospiraceae bacterium]
MYCIKCGVELADSEKTCPLCGTLVFHPHLPVPNGEKPYPTEQQPPQQVSPLGLQFILTMLFVTGLLIPALCDLQINRAITWSGFVMGAVLLGYICLVLPAWFRRPNPVIFVPIGFAALELYLLYISLATDGGWFLSFAFPVVGGFGLITTAVVTLTRYIRKGRLFIFGSAAILLGLFMPLMEFLLTITFHRPRFYGWSFYPLACLALLGITMICTGIFRPLRESLSRKFFI